VLSVFSTALISSDAGIPRRPWSCPAVEISREDILFPKFTCNFMAAHFVQDRSMKTTHYLNLAKATVFAAALSLGANLRAATSQTGPINLNSGADPAQLQTVVFRDSAEAGMLRRAYWILATGDHDYKGFRVKAMRSVEAAAKLLGLELAGDGKHREPQVLSDEKLREARGLITEVIGAAEVKYQKRFACNLNAAINHINSALSLRGKAGLGTSTNLPTKLARPSAPILFLELVSMASDKDGETWRALAGLSIPQAEFLKLSG